MGWNFGWFSAAHPLHKLFIFNTTHQKKEPPFKVPPVPTGGTRVAHPAGEKNRVVDFLFFSSYGRDNPKKKQAAVF